jgi:hypothetical protein
MLSRLLTAILLVKPSDDLSDDVGPVDNTSQRNQHRTVKPSTIFTAAKYLFHYFIITTILCHAGLDAASSSIS